LSQPLFGSWFSLTLVSNQGAAFGMLPEAGIFFLCFRLIVAALPFFFLSRLKSQPWAFQLAVGLVCGGALGNLIDQVLYGAVVDFLHLSFWPGIFNLADSSVVVGAILMALVILLGERRSKSPITTN
jgi:signal peptidase II